MNSRSEFAAVNYNVFSIGCFVKCHLFQIADYYFSAIICRRVPHRRQLFTWNNSLALSNRTKQNLIITLSDFLSRFCDGIRIMSSCKLKTVEEHYPTLSTQSTIFSNVHENLTQKLKMKIWIYGICPKYWRKQTEMTEKWTQKLKLGEYGFMSKSPTIWKWIFCIFKYSFSLALIL